MIELQEIEEVTVVRLAHGKVNALDIELCQAISATFRELSAGPHRGVVLTGAGNAFSAGVDLWHIVDGGPDYVDAFVPALVDAFEAVFTCASPVVAAVNGHAIAGGCVLTSCGDYRLMTTGRAGIGIPELLVGVPFPAAALEIVSFAAGAESARRAALSAAIYQPAQALEQGLVDELAEPEALLPAAIAHAARLASAVPADTFRLTKQHLRRLTPARGYDEEVLRIWRERSTDGWIRDYMNRIVGSR